MSNGWKVFALFAAAIIIGGFAHGIVLGEPTPVGQADDIEQKIDRLTVQQDSQNYAAFLVTYCEERKKGFRSLACIGWTQRFIREIAAPDSPQKRLEIPNRPGGCDISGCLPRPSS